MDAVCIFTFFGLFLSLYLTKLFISKKTKERKANLPPSPPNSLPIVGHLHLLRKPLHHALASLSARYGPILYLRCGIRRALVVSSAPLAQECFTANDLAFANRPKFHSISVITYNYTTIGFAPYGPQWRDMRRIANVQIFSGHRLNFFSTVLTDETQALTRQLFRDSGCRDFMRVELSPRLFCLAFNVMLGMMTGKRFYREETQNSKAVQFRQIMKMFSSYSASNIGDYLPSVIGWLARRRVRSRLAQIHSNRDKYVQSLLEERRRKIQAEVESGESAEHDKIRKTLMDAMLSLQRTHPEQYDDRFIKSLITAMITAGTETSSNTIEWAMSLLLNNPEKLEKVREEIDEVVGSGRLMGESDLSNLPYLNCVVSETLRLYPAAPLLLPHESLEECKVGGYDIPRGTMLLVNASVIQRNGETWEEPSKFLPERFMGGCKKAEVGMMLPFGMGRRKCPGEGFALKVVGLALGALAQCFEWRRIGLEEVDMQEGTGIIMSRLHPLQALCRPRPCMITALSQL